MNYKKVLAPLKKAIPHPVGFMGVVENEKHQNSFAVYTEKRLCACQLLDLITAMVRSSWRTYNDLMERDGGTKVNMNQFLGILYQESTKHKDGEMKYD